MPEKEKFLNQLRCGDNIEVLKSIPDESVDLIYIDPPFFSNRHYEVIWGNGAELRSFGDRWKGGIEHYIGWMVERLKELHRVLKPTGSIYVHLDWHASHYIKVEMDKIFGYKNFRNEIIWRYRGGGISKKNFGRKHDTILFYTKGEKWKFDVSDCMQEYSPETIKRMKNFNQAIRGEKGYVYNLNEEGKYPDDVWDDINIINPASKERIGYPTQKPEALLERIIKASSDEGDVVLDAFCGCGTTIAVAEKLNRKWIGIDVSPIAVGVMTGRLKELERKNGKKLEDFITYGISDLTIAHLKKMTGFEFQDWVVQQINGNASLRKVNDKGIDGYTNDKIPIQVKRSEGVGRNVIDNFQSAIRREGSKKGKVFAISFSKGAHEEVAGLKRKFGIDIELIDLKEFLIAKYGDHTHRK